jgi:hypothetical protein
MTIKWRYIFIFLLIVIMIILILFIFIREKTSSYQMECTLINHDKVIVNCESSHRKIWFKFPQSPIAHGAFDFKIGGGDEKICMKLKLKNKKISICQRGYLSILNNWKNELYLATIQMEELYNYSFYKYVNEWKEISEKEFPKEIAIENINVDLESYIKINPENKVFRSSNLAFLWKRLGSNLTTYNNWKKNNLFEVEKEYLIEFKKKYIDPYWKDEEIKNRIPKIMSIQDYN